MTKHSLNSPVLFGFYRGLTIEEALNHDIHALDGYFHIDGFFTPSSLHEIQNRFPDFRVPLSSIQILTHRFDDVTHEIKVKYGTEYFTRGIDLCWEKHLVEIHQA